jgi:hypothetical protein
MKLEIALVSLFVMFLTPNAAHAATNLVCELEDSFNQRVIDRSSASLSDPKIVLFLGQGDLMASVKDLAQPGSSDRKLMLKLQVQNARENSESHAETTYVAESAPMNETLAETSIELGPFERSFVLRCSLN